MKIYFYYSIKQNLNSYLVANIKTNEAILIDPINITKELLFHIEQKHLRLSYIFLTHDNPDYFTKSLNTILKIYSPNIFGMSLDNKRCVLTRPLGSGTINTAGFTVHYYAVPSESSHSYIYNIEHIFFTGKALSAGIIGKTSSLHATKKLQSILRKKVFTAPESAPQQNSQAIIFSASGPPTSIEAEWQYNKSLSLAPTSKKRMWYYSSIPHSIYDEGEDP